MMTIRPRAGAAWWFGAALLFAAVVGIHITGILTPPFMPDTLGAVEHALKTAQDIWLKPTSNFLPFYRPLPFFLMKLEVALVGIHVPMLLLGNLAIMALCFVTLLSVARALGAALLPSLAILIVLATDGIWQIPLIWMSDRQAVFALLLGWLAIRMMLPACSWRGVLLSAACLAAAIFSKETGYGFVPALLWLAWTRGDRRLPQAALLLLVALACLAWRVRVMGGFIGGEMADTQGIPYFFDTLTARFADLPLAERLAVHAYTAAANFLGMLYRPAFDSVGHINLAGPLSTRGDLYYVVLAVPAVVALVARPRAAVIGILVMLGNAVVGFSEYRARNHMLGFAAIGVLAAVGFSVMAEARRLVLAIGVALSTLILAVGAARTWRAYEATAAYNLAEYRRLGDVPGPDLGLAVLRIVRIHCADTPRWCVVSRQALREAGLL